MLQRSAHKKELKHEIGISDGRGFSLHALRRNYASLPVFPAIVAAVERGILPDRQRLSWDLDPELWNEPLQGVVPPSPSARS